jgi:hypothetical protein
MHNHPDAIADKQHIAVLIQDFGDRRCVSCQAYDGIATLAGADIRRALAADGRFDVTGHGGLALFAAS